MNAAPRAAPAARPHAAQVRAIARLGTPGLPPNEVALIRSLCRLYDQRLSLAWRVADAPPYDAVIRELRPDDIQLPPGPALPTLHLARGSVGRQRGDVQARPIRADAVLQWLQATERAWRHQDGPVAVAVAAAGRPPELRYRLRRWPPERLLHKDMRRMRMATLLARQPLTLAELAELSGVAQDQCAMFLRVLHASTLLDDVLPRATTPAALQRNGYLERAQHAVSALRRRIWMWL